MTHPPVRDDGRIDVTVTYLQMTAPPQHPPRSAPAGMKLALMRAEKPTVSFYRYLYNTVGEPWLWGDRRRLNDEALARIITDERVEIYVLYVAGVPAGFAELDRRVAGEIELAYFGLIPDFLGRGLGPYLLDQVIAIAWSHKPKRLFVHTCTLDHPKAVVTYQQAGFVPYRQETRNEPDPRADGVI